MGLITKSVEAVKSGANAVTNTYKATKKAITDDVDMVKSGVHHVKNAANKTNEFLHSDKVQAVKGKTGNIIQKMVKSGAEKTSNLFAKIKKYYQDHFNAELNDSDKEALQNYRDSLQDTINRTQNSPLQDAMQETIHRLDTVLQQDTIRTKDVAEATKPLTKGLNNIGRQQVIDAEFEQIEQPFSKEDMEYLKMNLQHHREMANMYERIPEIDRNALGISDEKMNDFINAYNTSADRLEDLIKNYDMGQPVYTNDVIYTDEPLKEVYSKYQKQPNMQKEQPETGNKETAKEDVQKSDNDKNENKNGKAEENMPPKEMSTKKVTDIDKVIEEAGQKQDEDKKTHSKRENEKSLDK
jgi:hypothetical protein